MAAVMASAVVEWAAGPSVLSVSEKAELVAAAGVVRTAAAVVVVVVAGAVRTVVAVVVAAAAASAAAAAFVAAVAAAVGAAVGDPVGKVNGILSVVAGQPEGRLAPVDRPALFAVVAAVRIRETCGRAEPVAALVAATAVVAQTDEP